MRKIGRHHMTKKQNTIVFLIISTLANILLTLILLIALSLLAIAVLKDKTPAALPVVFIAALGLGILIYHKVLGIIIKKWNLEDKLDPLFVRKYNKKNS